jgi:hypothetical protein
MELAEAHAMELGRVQGELDEEMQGYTDYHSNVHHRLHQLHEIVASSFDKVKEWCLPFLTKSAKVEEMID